MLLAYPSPMARTHRARRLRNALEPIAANVYFAPEAQARYADLGLGYLSGYFCSRSACMGQLPGEVVAAVFGVFSPEVVVPAVTKGWESTDRDTVLEARQAGATASLDRIISEANGGALPADDAARATDLLRTAGEGTRPNGHPIHAGLRSLGWPGDPVGDLWRAADLIREFRGDAHNAAWQASGVDAIEITLLTEAWWGIPLNSYAWTRGWSDDERAAGIERLRSRGLLDGDQLTPTGRTLREGIEDATDRGDDDVVAALGEGLEELCELVEPWARAVVAAGGYPVDPSTLGRVVKP
jgi:Helix-turn-helix family